MEEREVGWCPPGTPQGVNLECRGGGRRERARIGRLDLRELHEQAPLGGEIDTAEPLPSERRPKLLYVNLALTLLLMGCLLSGLLPLPVLFMIFFAIAMVINYPFSQLQKERIAVHAPNVLAVVSLIFAAGIFTGILSGTGMSMRWLAASFRLFRNGRAGSCRWSPPS